MILVGCDLHTRKQQVAILDTNTGEFLERELVHVGDGVEQFYAALPPPVTVGIESTGYSLWFHALLQQLGHTHLSLAWFKKSRLTRIVPLAAAPTAADRAA